VSETEDGEDDAPPETTDLTDPKAQRRARDRIKREQQEAEGFWRAVFNSKVGRREMWRLIIEDCHGFTPPFACGPNGFPNGEATWFQAGQYSIGQRLYQRFMQRAPEDVMLMHQENDPRFIKAKPQRRRGPEESE
jgi:hypothetical protein